MVGKVVQQQKHEDPDQLIFHREFRGEVLETVKQYGLMSTRDWLVEIMGLSKTGAIALLSSLLKRDLKIFNLSARPLNEGGVPPDQLEGFRRQWYQQVTSVNNAWKTPIFGEDKD